MPTKAASPRRAQMDDQGRLRIGEYRANKVAMFDTKNERFQEWAAPTPWSAPYDVVLDKRGFAWTGSMSTDVDNRASKPVFWVGNNQGASIIKLETLD